MTQSRITQSPALALAAGPGRARVTQSAVLVLGQPAPESRITQSPALALYAGGGPARITQSALLVLADQVPCVTRWAQCWRIERRDGEVFTFTSHDQPITFRGESYKACDSLAASATELAAIVGSVGNQELAGIIADESITEQDLYGGLFDRARLEVWMVPWENAGGEIPFRLAAGTTGNLSQGDEGFSMEVLTDGGLLQQRPLLQTYTPACRWELGDSRCQVDLDALAVNGSVTAVAAKNAGNAASHRIFTDSTRAEDDGYFDQGTLVWTSGKNNGLRSEIKSFAGGQFTLWQPMLHPIQAGDQYEA
ncbi:MAG TPA: DUF2163 domain-containing protein, partial [Arenicellales bacterium]|nr:DUF2163 domain-containing protein [Arenicellales bacterium]